MKCLIWLLTPLLILTHHATAQTTAGKTVLIEGHEQSYGYKQEDEFTAAKTKMIERPAELSKARAAFRKHVRPGYGLWLDNQSVASGSSRTKATTTSPPAERQSAVHFALKHADEYVWIHNSGPCGGYGPAKAESSRLHRTQHPACARPLPVYNAWHGRR